MDPRNVGIEVTRRDLPSLPELTDQKVEKGKSKKKKSPERVR
jgi:hypothetical protein